MNTTHGAPAIGPNPPASLAPNVGALFDYKGREYRCKGWLRPAEPPTPGPDWADFIDEILYDAAYQREGVRFRWCHRHEATHVAGSGVAGCLAAIAHIRVTGQAQLPPDVLESERVRAQTLARSRRLVG